MKRKGSKVSCWRCGDRLIMKYIGARVIFPILLVNGEVKDISISMPICPKCIKDVRNIFDYRHISLMVMPNRTGKQ